MAKPTVYAAPTQNPLGPAASQTYLICHLSVYGIPLSAYILTLSKSVGFVGNAAKAPDMDPAMTLRYRGEQFALIPSKALRGSQPTNTSVPKDISRAMLALKPLQSPPRRPSLAKTFRKPWKIVRCSLPCPAFYWAPYIYILTLMVSTGCTANAPVPLDTIPMSVRISCESLVWFLGALNYCGFYFTVTIAVIFQSLNFKTRQTFSELFSRNFSSTT